MTVASDGNSCFSRIEFDTESKYTQRNTNEYNVDEGRSKDIFMRNAVLL